MQPRRLEALLVAGLSAISVFAQAAAFNSVRFDDAYITYRYSQNLATGSGFVFNPGEHVLGTASPGHALLGALFYALAGKIAFPAVMAAVGCIGWTAQAACTYALLRDALGRAGAAFVALAIAAGATRAYFWVPLETNVVAALVLTAFLLASHRRWIACGVIAGMAVVFSADALVACAAIAAVALFSERARAWRPAASFVLVSGAWGAFSLHYFGTLVPHALQAKVTQSARPLVDALFYPALSFAPWSRLVDSGTEGSWLTVIPMWGLAVAGAFLTARRSLALAGLAGYGAVLTFAGGLLHAGAESRWRLYPTTLVFAIFALSAISIIAERGTKLARARIRASRYVATPVACALVACFALEAAEFEEHEPLLASYGPRDSLGHTVAAYLAAAAEPTDYVDAEEVGTVAYLSGLPMVDHAGLVSEDGGGDLIRRLRTAARGRPSRVRWAVLNRWEAEAGKATFAHFGHMIFREGRLELSVYDLRRP